MWLSHVHSTLSSLPVSEYAGGLFIIIAVILVPALYSLGKNGLGL